MGQTHEGSLLGREEECRLIAGLLADAVAGRSAALVVSGEPGIGKSALLTYARDHAQEMTVLSARGVEAEAELAFATLHELLRPILNALPGLPAPQAAALASALALGPPTVSDKFTVGVATLSLLAASAEERPLLALLDDAHWADSSSRDALLFAGRRLRAEGVVLLLGVREGAEFAAPGIEQIALGPLSRDACIQLIADIRGISVAVSVADRVVADTRGNPLALIQLAAVLTADQLVGRDLLPEPLPSVDIEAAFLARVAELPIGFQRALVVAAASESGAMDEIAAAASALRLRPASFQSAEARDLITLHHGRLQFQHPLLRSALYHAAPPQERRAAHRALANVLTAKCEKDRAAWHLAASAIAPDERVADAMDEAGASARRRNDFAAAAAALARAARLTPGIRQRAGRLVAAAEAAQLAGRSEFAARLLDEALHDVPVELRADAIRLRAAVDIWRGRAREARQLLLSEAARVEANDPARAVAMLLDAAVPAVMALEVEAAAETALRACTIAGRADAETQLFAAAVAGACFVACGNVAEAKRLLEPARTLVDETRPSGAISPMIRHFIWHLYIVLEWYADARRLYDGAIEAARAASVPGLLPFALAFRAELRFRVGDWHGGFADASESALLAEQTGQWTQLPHSLAVLARLEAGRGDQAACREHCARALALAHEHGSEAIKVYTAAALGLVELGLGRSGNAVVELEPAVRLVDARGGSPAAVPVHADLIEAYIRSGRTRDAEEALVRLENWARRSGHVGTLSACARCRGLLAGEDSMDARFGDTVATDDEGVTPFERARTRLAYGERLRRSRRLVEARGPLRHALNEFEELGARPWAERARAELRAARDVPGAQAPGLQAMQTLTAQELQVARIVANGASNREAAAQLFLSPKTIDFHLRHIYRKLGLRSRSDLVRTFLRQSQQESSRGRRAKRLGTDEIGAASDDGD